MASAAAWRHSLELEPPTDALRVDGHDAGGGCASLVALLTAADPDPLESPSCSSTASSESDDLLSPLPLKLPPIMRKKKPTAAPKPKRMRRKDEIALLRDESRELALELQELRDYWKSGGGGGSSSIAVVTAMTPRWKLVADAQRAQLHDAEATNRRLRAEYLLHRKAARQLRKVLMKRATSSTAFDSALYLLELPSAQRVLAESRGDFETIIRDTTSMHADIARIRDLIETRRAEQRRQQSATFRDWTVQNEYALDCRDVFLELVDCYTLPFTRHQVAEAMRRHRGQPTPRVTSKYCCEFFQQLGDMALRQMISAFSKPTVDGHIRNKEVSRCFADDDETLFVSTNLITPVTPTGEPINGIVLKEQKWTLLREDDTIDGLGKRSHRVTTAMRSYHKITCVDLGRGYEAYWTSSVLLDSLIPMWTDSLSIGQRRLESTLIEQCMRRSTTGS